MSVLEPAEAYRIWAPSYGAENAITQPERELVERLGPSPAGLRLLDAGCGTGRRLRETGARRAMGIDLSPEMLAAGRAEGEFGSEVELIAADMQRLPLSGRPFDLIWCRLAIGHVADCAPTYRELARVADLGARVIVTDFHAAAWAAGHRRTFRDGPRVVEVAHHVHTTEVQIAAAKAAGLVLVDSAEAQIGPEVRHFYEAAGRGELYLEHCGLPVVCALAFTLNG